ncbi:retrotransposon protein, putative, unclassified [Tanacetum coccineum]
MRIVTQQSQADVAKMSAYAIQQEHENLRAKISSQIKNAITNHIPSQVDSSVRNYIDQDDPHDDAHPEGENSADVLFVPDQMEFCDKGGFQPERLAQVLWHRYAVSSLMDMAYRMSELQPDGFVDPDNPNHVYRLKTALYGLKQAPRPWYNLLSSFLLSQGFSKGMVDPILFISRKGKDILPSSSPMDLVLARMYVCSVSGSAYRKAPTCYKKNLSIPKRSCQSRTMVSKDSAIAITTFADADPGRQKSAAISSTEAKYIALSGCCAQVLWMRSQLTDYGLGFNKIPMYYDNKSGIALCYNNVQHSRSKHINIRYHFIKEQVENGVVELYFVSTEYQLADIFTKALCRERIEFLIDKWG